FLLNSSGLCCDPCAKVRAKAKCKLCPDVYIASFTDLLQIFEDHLLSILDSCPNDALWEIEKGQLPSLLSHVRFLEQIIFRFRYNVIHMSDPMTAIGAMHQIIFWRRIVIRTDRNCLYI